MHLPDLITHNKILLNSKQKCYANKQTDKFSLKNQLQKDEFVKISFKGYDRNKLSSHEILEDVAIRLLESINRPLTKRKSCNEGYLPLDKDATPLGEYKLDIATGLRSFRVLKYPDHYELHKNVYSEPDDGLTKVNVLKVFPKKVQFHSVERKNPQAKWEEPAQHLETANKAIIKLYNRFFSQLEML